MSRRTLVDIQAGRDPIVFAENLKEWRLEMGWTLVRLEQESGVSRRTLSKIEQGNGCTPAIERKLSIALRTAEGGLWKKYERRYSVLRTPDKIRWFFFDRDEAAYYISRHEHEGEKEPLSISPQAIQNEEERWRIGRIGLSRGFVGVTTAVLVSGTLGSSLIEIFGNVNAAEGSPAGTFEYIYCLHGSIRVRNGDDLVEVKEGSILTYELREPCYYEPLRPIGPKEPPALIIHVSADPYRLKPLTER